MELAIHNVLMAHILIHRILETYYINTEIYKYTVLVKIGLNLQPLLRQFRK